MSSTEGEHVDFSAPIMIEGAAEVGMSPHSATLFALMCFFACLFYSAYSKQLTDNDCTLTTVIFNYFNAS